MNKQWLNKNADAKKVNSLMNETNASKYLCSALVNRNINTLSETLKFLKPSLSNLYNPYLMRGMRKAVNRIQQAIKDGETICVHGDYD